MICMEQKYTPSPTIRKRMDECQPGDWLNGRTEITEVCVSASGVKFKYSGRYLDHSGYCTDQQLTTESAWCSRDGVCDVAPPPVRVPLVIDGRDVAIAELEAEVEKLKGRIAKRDRALRAIEGYADSLYFDIRDAAAKITSAVALIREELAELK